MSLPPGGPLPAAAPAGTAGPAAGWRRALRRAYGAALAIAAVAVLLLRRKEIADLLAGARILPLVGALALGLLSLVQSAWFWSRCLAHLGAPQPVGRVLESTVAAVPARYLPGGVWYAAGRVVHLRQSGIPGTTVSLVAVLETFLSFVVAVTLGTGLLLAGRDDGGSGVAALVTLAVILAVLASPSVINPVLRRVAARRGVDDIPLIRWSTYVELLAHLLVFWVASAGAFLCYLAAFPAIGNPGVVRTAGTFLLAWAAGFLAVFAPQGAGVFEATMAAPLSGAPLGALALVVGGYRAITAVRDALALLALSATQRAAIPTPLMSPTSRGPKHAEHSKLGPRSAGGLLPSGS